MRLDKAHVSPSSPSVLAQLEGIQDRFRTALSGLDSELALRTARAELLGKKGELTAILRGMAQVPPDQKKQVGEAVNRVREELEAIFEAALVDLKRKQRAAELAGPPFDLSMPGRPIPRGHRHPVSLVMDEVLDIFRSLGFEIAWGPEVELEVNNFEKLAFPPDHPATDMQDTFWVDVAGAPAKWRTLLRTHTSSVQVREMSDHGPPLALVSGGAVYRRDDDVTHSPMFHQIEGFYVARDVSFAELKGVLTAFTQRLYGESTPIRFRPSYFPFVEPGAEADVGCVFCSEEDGTRAACRVCKGTGWLEVLGCGMIHPSVLTATGIDPEWYSGFAFGLGVERIAMLRYGIPDIRVLFENDPRFLAQF
ncbi:MAG: phenylalanine--tRNA ligase subunit alpha [Sorangiineae bacterium NIC37A_2]|nr:MAG: phenylalanine--tRNA ligase subunit alpha [Sorangiineae bacterium NIC37A_2]